MAIKVKLILPDNLQSTFVRADVINGGDLYSTARKSLDPSVNANNHTLTFGIELVDSLTREPVSLTRIKELRISNDPQFDPNSTYVIEDWPSTTFSDSLDYFIDLDPTFFLYGDPSGSVVRSTDVGTGLFHVRNWPLSATGGLSTIYFSLIAQSGTDLGTYPEGSGIYDRIFWQAELPSAPGVPELISPTENYAGRRAFYQFRASEEGATGLYGTGISRYLGSTIEVIKNGSSFYLKSNNNTTGSSRTLCPYSAELSSLFTGTSYSVFDSYDFTWSGGAISGITGSASTVNENVALTAGAGNGFMLYSDSVESLNLMDAAALASEMESRTSWTASYALDFAAQAVASMAVDDFDADVSFWVKIVGVDDFSSPLTSEEIACRIDVPATGDPTATLYTVVNNVESAGQQVTTLPLHVRPLLLQGGLFEMYMQTVANTQAQGSSYVEFYYTPIGSDVSYILASALVPRLSATALETVRAAIGAAVSSGTVTVNIDEITIAAGVAHLDMDLGDCFKDDESNANYPYTVTASTEWEDALTSDYLLYLSDTVANPVAQVGWLQFDQDDPGTYKEIQAVRPSMSDRMRVSWSMRHGYGEFYVAFSPNPTDELFQTTRPMGARCNQEYGPSLEYIHKPTLYVGFSALTKQVFITQRLLDNTQTTYALSTYEPTGYAEEYSLTVSSRGPSGSADSLWIVLRRNNGIFGMLKLDSRMLPSASSGLGWYVAAGVRGDAFGDEGTHTDLYDFGVEALPLAVRPDAQDPVSVRHFYKANAGASYVNPLMGQHLLYGATDFKGYTRSLPARSNLGMITVVASTTGSNYDIDNWDGSGYRLLGTPTLDGHTLATDDLILVKDQADTQKNGIYTVLSSGNWALFDFPDDLGGNCSDVEILVENGTINGDTHWRVDPYSGTYAPGLSRLTFSSNIWAQRIEIGAVSPFYPTVDLSLIEFKLQHLDSSSRPDSVYVRLYADNNNAIDAPLTDWVEITGTTQASFNSLFPYQLSVSVPVATGDKVWLAIMPPMNTNLGTANSKNTVPCPALDSGDYRGWNVLTDMWLKVFARHTTRRDNVYDDSYLHFRVRGESHARISGHATTLNAAMVDITPPQYGATGRPRLAEINAATVRTASVNVEASDSRSGVIAFRIGRETDYGAVAFTPWQSWREFASDDSTVQYVAYLYGTWPLTPGGVWNRKLLGQNAGSNGPRRIWAQVMDGAGNISESFPITVLAQGIGIVDTVPPSGSFDFVSGTSGVSIAATNSTDLWLKTDGSDRVTGIKDVRVRPVSGFAADWSKWYPWQEYLKYALSSSAADGTKRLEIQVRDYGNNIQQADSVWDVLYRASDRGVLFTRCARWTSPLEDAVDSVYLAGIRQQVFTDYALADSQSASFTGYTAFYAVSQDEGTLQRRVYLRPTDHVVVMVDSIVVTNYTIDAATGLLVFDSAPSSSAELEITITRHSPVLYRWDGTSMIKMADLGGFGERAVLSMAVTDNYLFLGCASGNIYSFDGRLVDGPVFTATDGSDGLPVTALAVHRFAHEAVYYVYAATSTKPRLWRSPVATAVAGASWLRVAETGYLNASSGAVNALCSAYNQLFLGTSSGSVLRYRRAQDPDDSDVVNETLTVSTISSQNLGEFDGAVPSVSSLAASGPQVFAGLGDRPEVWNYTEEIKDNPARPEDWATIVHDEMFVNDPAPAQFYYDGLTTSRLRDYQQSSTEWVVMTHQISDPNTESGFRSILLMKCGAEKALFFEHGAGSDWEQVMNRNVMTSELQDVYVATTGHITLSGLPKTIDGVTITQADVRVLVKDQSDPADNGIYVSASGAWSRAADLDEDEELSQNQGVYVANGAVNGATSWLLDTAGPYSLGTTELVYRQPSWTLEFEAQHLKDADSDTSNTGKQGLLISDGHHVLEVILSPTTIRIQSGAEYEEAAYIAPNDFSVFTRGASNLVYPESGVKRIWSFDDDTQEDQGPYWTGTGTSVVDSTSLIDWKASYGVTGTTVAGTQNVAGIGKTEVESNTASFEKITHFMYVTPTPLGTGDPRIINTSVLTQDGNIVMADAGTQLMVRLRIEAKNGGNLLNARLRMSWASGTNQFYTWIEQPLVDTDEFYTYVFDPAWDGPIEALALEISGLPTDSTRPDNFDIDYIAITSKYAPSGLRDNLTPIRITVEGKHVKLYVGRNDLPLIDAPNFLGLPTMETKLRFGKIDPDADPSWWGWGNLRFLAAETYAPITRKEHDFRLAWRFPSAGPVRALATHNGTLHALTDGIDPILTGDNPDDRQLKVFSWQPGIEAWKNEAGVPQRETDGTGLIRPFDAVSYDGSLLVLGQRANIRAPEPISMFASFSSLQLGQISAIFDGGGGVIAPGSSFILASPYAGKIIRATVLLDQVGSLSVEVRKCTSAQYDGGVTHPASGDKISASAPPSVVSSSKSQDETLTGWTTTIAEGDYLQFFVSSSATATWAMVQLDVQQS